MGLSGGKPLCTHLISQNQETPGWRRKREEEWLIRCQQTDWKCSSEQQISLSNVTAFPLTSFLALGRSMRIFKARRSWLAFFTQTLNREKRDTVNPRACSALEQMLAYAWSLPCFYQTIKQLWIKENNSNLDCLKHAFFSPFQYLYAEGVKAERHLNVLTEGPSILHQESSTQETATTDFKPSTVTSAHITNILLCPNFTWIPDYRKVICNKWLYSSLLCDLRYRLQRAIEHVVADMKSLFYKCFS